ncbi:MAG: LysM peptidoglycan-binding domain-containing protein [Bacteroidota bacterium]|jgi:membrane-bound lytic murein transglycosylase D|nr:LysM peptidoglycan-binding domain-containing protein [Bacteroidota bacterium]
MSKFAILAIVSLAMTLPLFPQGDLSYRNPVHESSHHESPRIENPPQKSRDIPQVAVEDSAIIYPESMQEELSDLLRTWQLDMSKVDTTCERGENVVFHDSVYVNRLYCIPTVMELSYNQVVRSYIDMYTVRRREQVSYMLTLGQYYFPMFEAALDRHGLPLELKHLPVIESALNPLAVSRAGATGLWQFMLRTAKGYNLEINSLVDERRDPYKSTEAAVLYLKDLYTIYGDWNLVIAAYNCGPGNVNKAIARSGGSRDYWAIYHQLPRETRGYVPAFIAANYVMNHHADHNICPVHFPESTLTALDTVHVNKEIHLEQIAGVLGVSIDELRRLNPQFKKDIVPGNYKPYALVLPSEIMYAFIDQTDSIMNFDRSRYFTHRTLTLDGGGIAGATEEIIYRVRSGDNLSTIARRNGTTVSALKSMNNLRSDRLRIGQQLIVGHRVVEVQQVAQVSPGGKTTTVNTYYRVKKGDTLGEIARRNNVLVSQLQSWNGLRSTRIGIGDQLIVKQEEVPAEEDKADEKETILSNYLEGQIRRAEESGSLSPEMEFEMKEVRGN